MLLNRLFRNLRGDLGFVVAFVVTLGLGIGANAALFSLVSGVLLKPLPYPRVERLVAVKQQATHLGQEDQKFSFLELEAYRKQAKSLEEIVEYGRWSFNVLDRGDPHRAHAGLVTANFFRVLGMEPQYGRLLIPGDRGASAPPVVVLTDEYWRSAFASDPGVIGQELNLTSKKALIVGILQPGIHYLAEEDGPAFYANYSSNDHYVSATMQEVLDHRMTTSFALLAASATVETAQSELDYIANQLHAEYPKAYPDDRGFRTMVIPLQETLISKARPVLLASFAGSLLVLLLACANVANLTVVRAMRRSRETAIRMAVGATLWSQRKYLLAETLTLSFAGAAFGFLVARSILQLLRAFAATLTTRSSDVELDYRVLLFTFVIATLCALGFAFLPGLLPTDRLSERLAQNAAGTGSTPFRRRSQRLLVVAQLAISFLLLFASIQLQRTLHNLYSLDPGFDLEQVLTVRASKFSRTTKDDLAMFAETAISEISALPGVSSIAMTGSPPLGGINAFPLIIRTEGADEDSASIAQPTVFATITPGYFSTLGAKILRGREFTGSDRVDTIPVVVVNETAANTHFGNEDPVGKRISYDMGQFFGGASDWLTVVGVVADMRTTSLQGPPEPAMYIPNLQSLPPDTFMIRTEGVDPYLLAPGVGEIIRRLDPERPLEGLQTLAESRNLAVESERLNALLFSAFAFLALAIAALGVGAMLSWSVAAKQREFAVRAAIGATGRSLFLRALGESSILIAVGGLFGTLGAILFGKVMANMLYGVHTVAPLTLLSAGTLLALAGLAASAIPATRAMKSDPASLLRLE